MIVWAPNLPDGRGRGTGGAGSDPCTSMVVIDRIRSHRSTPGVDVSDELTFVAYYYPGWHQEPWKPSDEWALLDEDRPIFPGHVPLDKPLAGLYDDTDPDVLRRQIGEAAKAGISAFSFFLYYGPDGYVLDQPTVLALKEAANAPGCLSVGVTWCMRLPHQYFPIPISDDSAPLASAEPRDVPPPTAWSVADILPPEMRNVSVRTVCLLTRGRSTERHPPPAHRFTLPRSTEEEDELRDPLDSSDPSVAQILAFMSALQSDRVGESDKLALSDLESRLALTGLLDLPIKAVIGLIELAYARKTGGDGADIAQCLSLESLAELFAPAAAHVEPRDVGAIARLARKGGRVDVFSTLILTDIYQNLSAPARQAFTLRDLRAAIESAASIDDAPQGS
jgi:Glycosyltransferase WbsX